MKRSQNQRNMCKGRYKYNITCQSLAAKDYSSRKSPGYRTTNRIEKQESRLTRKCSVFQFYNAKHQRKNARRKQQRIQCPLNALKEYKVSLKPNFVA